MRYALAALLFAASLVLLFGSGATNYWNGLTYGSNPLEQSIFGLNGGALELVGYCTLPIAVYLFCSRTISGLFMGSAAMVLWAGCMAYSLTAATNLVSTTKQAHTSAKAIQTAQYTDLLRQRDDLLQQVKWEPQLVSAKDPAAIIQLIEAHKQHRRWTSTSECTDATVPASRAYCEQYRQMLADLKMAEAYDTTRGKLDAVRAKIERAAEVTTISLTGNSLEAANAPGVVLASWATQTASPSGEQVFWASSAMIAIYVLMTVFGPSVSAGVAMMILQPPVARPRHFEAPRQSPSLANLLARAGEEGARVYRGPTVPDTTAETAPLLTDPDMQAEALRRFWADHSRRAVEGEGLPVSLFYAAYVQRTIAGGVAPVTCTRFVAQSLAMMDLGLSQSRISGTDYWGGRMPV